jgi:hypothetical protein
MKKKVLVSFSGGETSAYMAQWLWTHKRDEYEMIFVFANTGEENEETLIFTQKCAQHFGFPLVWIEGVFNKTKGIGTTHRVVDFNTASRKGEPFEAHCSTYGIPNIANPQCSRELKGAPIISYARSLGWKKYYTAIGIRNDEIDRVSVQRKKNRLIYPLIEEIPTTKPEINLYWRDMPFRLNLKGYQGNCKWCWKKSLPKLIRIAKDRPEDFDFPKRMEKEYANYIPEHRKQAHIKAGKKIYTGITFFTNNLSANDILEMSKTADPIIRDDSKNYNIQTRLLFDEDDGNESCEVFSNCGDD